MGHEITVNKTEKSRIEEFDRNNIGFGKVFTDHMLVADFDGERWSPARIEPYKPMALSPATSALHYGQSIFEGMKAFRQDGNVYLFRPTDNWRRFNKSAARMVMPELPESLFMEGLRVLIDTDRDWIPDSEGASLYIRPFMFAMDDYIGVKPSDKYRFVIFCCPVGPYYSKPLKVKIEEHYSRSAPGGTGSAKCAGNYAAALLATRNAQKEGFDQVLWTDAVNHELVEETGTTNFFAVYEDRVVTPQLNETLLAGITRDSVIQLLRHFGVNVEERPYTVAELKSDSRNGLIKELFITGTAATLINIESFGHQGEIFDVFSNGNRDLSVRIKSTLDSIKKGLTEDTFNWRVPVN